MDSKVVSSASCVSDADILTEVIPDSIEDQDDDFHLDDLNLDDLDYSPPLTHPYKSNVEQALDKQQDFSLFSFYGTNLVSYLENGEFS